jgi:hypothetical protein
MSDEALDLDFVDQSLDQFRTHLLERDLFDCC